MSTHRIVRNKAAEKAKSVNHHGHGHGHGHGGHGGNSGGGSNSGPVSPVSSQTASVITHGSAASTGNNQHQQQQQHAMQQQQHVLPPHDSPHQRPGSYSINGILGIPQTDPNGNIKRKRDDHGQHSLSNSVLFQVVVVVLSWLCVLNQPRVELIWLDAKNSNTPGKRRNG